MRVLPGELKRVMGEVAASMEASLDRLLPGEDQEPGRVHAAMRYSALGGGKRIRPALCLFACRACGQDWERAYPAAAALEMIHVYSLVHDDLPAMDDDDLRRGRPSCHKAFDEATAILAGDGLLTEAFAALAASYGEEPELALALVKTLAAASGSRGMVGGQMLDMEATGDQAEGLLFLERLHGMKTGALLRASVRMGAQVGGASAGQLASLEAYGRAIGLAFQVVDDILDETSSTEELGKTSGKDAAQGKLTYPGLLGLAGARQKAEELLGEAEEALAPFGEQAALLRSLSAFIVERSR